MIRVRARLTLATLVPVALGLMIVAVVVELSFANAMNVLGDSIKARSAAHAMRLANEVSFAVATDSKEDVEGAITTFLKARGAIVGLVVGKAGGKVLGQRGAAVPQGVLAELKGERERSVTRGGRTYAFAPVTAESKVVGYVVYIEEQTAAQRLRSRSRLIYLLACFIVIVLIGVVSFFIGGRFSRPLETMARVARSVDEGDLTQPALKMRGDDEIAALGGAIDQMTEALRTQVGAIKSAADGVLENASQVMTATAQLSQTASAQAAAIAEVTTSAEEVRQTSKASLENARQIVTQAERSVQDSAAGRTAVDSSVVVMRRIRNQVEAITVGTESLRGKVGEVGEIIASVNEIAGQSNLLAVNAAIEAAKAGEFGRGFAVVAQEVKDLAEQSRRATTQVRDTLLSIQQAIEEVVVTARAGRDEAEAGVASIQHTGKVIGGLTEVIANTAEMAQHIATNADEQVVGIEEIAQAMGSVNDAAQETLQGTRQVQQSGQQLDTVARELDHLVTRYRLSSTPGTR